MNPARSVWSQRSACHDKEDIFITDKPNRLEYAPICSSCPVKDLCLAHAIVHKERGIWGGMTYLERSKLPETVKLSLNLPAVPREKAIAEFLQENQEENLYPLEQLARLELEQKRKQQLSSVRERATAVLGGLDALLLSLQDISSPPELLAG